MFILGRPWSLHLRVSPGSAQGLFVLVGMVEVESRARRRPRRSEYSSENEATLPSLGARGRQRHGPKWTVLERRRKRMPGAEISP